MATLWDRISGNVGPWWYPYWGCMLADIRDEGGIWKGLRWWWISQVVAVWRYRSYLKKHAEEA